MKTGVLHTIFPALVIIVCCLKRTTGFKQCISRLFLCPVTSLDIEKYVIYDLSKRSMPNDYHKRPDKLIQVCLSSHDNESSTKFSSNVSGMLHESSYINGTSFSASSKVTHLYFTPLEMKSLLPMPVLSTSSLTSSLNRRSTALNHFPISTRIINVNRQLHSNLYTPASSIRNFQGRSSELRDFLSGEDLPNILGINPLEFAIIAGILYYFYGPEKLTEYAKAAGVFVSTYFPIVQQVTADIFSEFKDYFDEERERDVLKKQGFDMSKIQRRTTNIFERFAENFAMLNPSESEGVAGGSGFTREVDTLQSAYSSTKTGDNVAFLNEIKTPLEQKVDKTTKKRKTKKEVLIERDVDIDEVIDATEKSMNKGSEEISESIRVIKERLDSLKISGQRIVDASAAQESTQRRSIGYSPLLDEGSLQPSNPSLLSSPSPSLTKFQQQLSGQWNQQVMATSAPDADFQGGSLGQESDEIMKPFTNSNDDEQVDHYDMDMWSSFTESSANDSDEPVETAMNVSRLSLDRTTIEEGLNHTGDIPLILTAEDYFPKTDSDAIPSTSYPVPIRASKSASTQTADSFAILNMALTPDLVNSSDSRLIQLIQTIDNDYFALRSKLLELIKGQSLSQIKQDNSAIDPTNL